VDGRHEEAMRPIGQAVLSVPGALAAEAFRILKRSPATTRQRDNLANGRIVFPASVRQFRGTLRYLRRAITHCDDAGVVGVERSRASIQPVHRDS
jgi:hypothetical protein